MRKLFFSVAIVMAWGAAYSDWLEPGWLRYGVPAGWDRPFETETVYDAGLCIRRTMQGAAVARIEQHIPDRLEFWNWGEKEEQQCFTP